MEQGPVTIYRAAITSEAHLIRGLLQAAEIDAQVTGENQAYAGLSSVMPVEVMVSPADKERALAVIADYQETLPEADSEVIEREVAPEQRLSLREHWLEATAVVSILLMFYYYAIAALVWPKSYVGYEWSLGNNSLHLIQDIPIIFMILFIMNQSGKSWADFGVVRPQWFVDLPLASCIWLLDMTVWVILPAFVPFELWPESTSDIVFNGLLVHLLTIIIVFVGAFMEELLLRCYLITRLEQVYHSKTVCVLLSSLIFAGYHMYQGLPGLIGAGLGGLLYGGMFCLVRRIWPIAIAHALYNLTLYWISQAS